VGYACACCDLRGEGRRSGESDRPRRAAPSFVIRSAARHRTQSGDAGPRHRDRSVSAAALRPCAFRQVCLVGGGRTQGPRRFRRHPTTHLPPVAVLPTIPRRNGHPISSSVGLGPWPLESDMLPVNSESFSPTKIQKENQRSIATGQAELLFLETKQSLSCCHAGYPSPPQATQAKLPIRIFTSTSL